MKIYNYHPIYKYYTGESLADESPLELGEYLIPAYSTEKTIPEYLENTIPIFQDNNWIIIFDNRGTYFSKETGLPYYNPDPKEEPINYTKIEPPCLDSKIEKLKWNGNGWDIQKLTLEEKLQKSGISIEEIKQLLRINS